MHHQGDGQRALVDASDLLERTVVIRRRNSAPKGELLVAPPRSHASVTPLSSRAKHMRFACNIHGRTLGSLQRITTRQHVEQKHIDLSLVSGFLFEYWSCSSEVSISLMNGHELHWPKDLFFTVPNHLFQFLHVSQYRMRRSTSNFSPCLTTVSLLRVLLRLIEDAGPFVFLANSTVGQWLPCDPPRMVEIGVFLASLHRRKANIHSPKDKQTVLRKS